MINSDKIQAMNGCVLIKEDIKEQVTVGGILLPDTAESKRILTGKVLSISSFLLEDGTYKRSPFEVGDTVVYSMHAAAGGIWVDDVDKRTYRLAKWSEILGKLNA